MRVIILGAGPAGLFTGWLLHQRGIEVTLLEASSHAGGLSRSFEWHGFTCDLGTHRLFTTDEGVLKSLMQFTPMVRHTRRSQLYFQGQWLSDPVNVLQLTKHCPPLCRWELLRDYFFPASPTSIRTFDDFVTSKYGDKLNAIFFRPYTEKLFKTPTDQISAYWAERKVRIAGFLDFLRESNKRKFSYFYYPVEGGFGAIIAPIIQQLQGAILYGAKVARLLWDDRHIKEIQYTRNGTLSSFSEFDAVISTLPLSTLAQAAGVESTLSYQTVNFVYLWINKTRLTNNHWLYFIDRDVNINRLVEFKNLSPVEQPKDTTVICAEVTGSYTIRKLTRGVEEDLRRCQLLQPGEILDSFAIPYPFAYPIYSLDFASSLTQTLTSLSRLDNLFILGRAGEFRHYELDDIYRRAWKISQEVLQYTRFPRPTEAYQERSAMKQSPLVHVVILTFNHYADTRECLLSLRKSDYANMHIVVVDNASSDGTPDKIRKEFPEITLIENSRNLGVPWGYNVGISYALSQGADYVMILNNDTVAAPDMLSQLVQEAQKRPECGVLVPRIVYYDNPERIWAVGGKYRRFPPAHVIVGHDTPIQEFPDPIELDYALTCALLISRETFEQVGLFDPGYFFYFDDWDFSQRVRDTGIKILFVPTAHIRHKVSKSVSSVGSEQFWYTWGASATRFYRRHASNLPTTLIHIAYIALRESIKGNWKKMPAFFRGIKNGFQNPLGEFPSAEESVIGHVQP